jgi:hypothetical protein
MCRSARPHRGEALRVVEQLVARTGEDDQSAIENDHLGRKLERDAGMLLNQQQSQLSLMLQAIQAAARAAWLSIRAMGLSLRTPCAARSNRPPSFHSWFALGSSAHLAGGIARSNEVDGASPVTVISAFVTPAVKLKPSAMRDS